MGGLGTAICKALAKDGYRGGQLSARFPQQGRVAGQIKAEGFDIRRRRRRRVGFDSCQAMVEKVEKEGRARSMCW
jgi:acetoacetyl-CoA reductase